MRYALMSDIHANRQAWEAVLTDISCVGADAIVCLGDVVGYGPAPLTHSLLVAVAPPPYPVELEKAASAILSNNLAAAIEHLTLDDPPASVVEGRKLLEQSRTMEKFIHDSFKADVGKTIAVEVGRTRMTLSIEEVTDQGVRAKRQVTTAGGGVASAPFSFKLAQLSSRERLRRASAAGAASLAMYRGLLALRASRVPSALKFFKATDSELGTAILDLSEHRRQERVEAAALATWTKIQGQTSGALDQKAAKALIVEMQAFHEAYGETKLAGSVADAVEALQKKLTLVATDNYIRNPGFESGELAPWKLGEDKVGHTKVQIVDENPYKWITGETMSYEHFNDRFKAGHQHAGEDIVIPTKDETGEWYHGGHDKPYWFICEWEK